MRTTAITLGALGIAGFVAYQLLKPKPAAESKYPNTWDLISNPFESGEKLLDTFVTNLEKINLMMKEDKVLKLVEEAKEAGTLIQTPKLAEIPNTTPAVIKFIDESINKSNVQIEEKPITTIKTTSSSSSSIQNIIPMTKTETTFSSTLTPTRPSDAEIYKMSYVEQMKYFW